ncbi:MAG: ComEA family DNA-binding protein [Candidatus Methylomirabilaceae bacterium]
MAYTRREAVVATLVGLALALMIWGPVLVRPFGEPPPADLRTIALHPGSQSLQAHLPRAPATVAKTTPLVPIDINRADVTALQTLPGVGPTLARRIADHRRAHGRFATPDQLLEVEGFGPKRYETLKPWIEAR